MKCIRFPKKKMVFERKLFTFLALGQLGSETLVIIRTSVPLTQLVCNNRIMSPDADNKYEIWISSNNVFFELELRLQPKESDETKTVTVSILRPAGLDDMCTVSRSTSRLVDCLPCGCCSIECPQRRRYLAL
jgi:hypothetical protein